MRLERGTDVLVDLDPTVGHEQKSVRACVVVSDPAVAGAQARSIDKRRIVAT